jgi:hypothetical protein
MPQRTRRPKREPKMSDLPQDWDQEAAFKRVADRRGLTVEELRAELAKRAKEWMESSPQKATYERAEPFNTH